MKILNFIRFSWVKKFLPRGLFARSLLILVTPILLIQVILSIVFFDNHWERITNRLVYAVAGEIAIMVDLMESHEVGIPIETIKSLNQNYLQLYMHFDSGSTLTEEQEKFYGWGHIVGSALHKEIDRRIDKPFRVLINMKQKDVDVHIQFDHGILYVDIPLRRIFSSTAYIFLLWMGGVSIALLIVAVLFMRNQIRPIKRLAVAADWFGKGRDVSFFKVSGSKEVRQAAQSFLNMKDRIHRQIEQRTTMLAGVSHDLKTPLTRMKLQAEMMPESADKEAMKSDLEDMQRMIDAYLQFVRGDGDEEVAENDLKMLITRCSAPLSNSEFKIEIKGEGDFTAPVKSFAFERAMINLLDNAKRYASQAIVSLEKQSEVINITIDDDGLGIPEKERAEVFKPFYRGDKSRETKSGSVGLGLNIAQDCILSHGGKISLSDSPQGGLRVIIQMPL